MKQFFYPLTEPLGATWCLMLGGVVWLVWRRQWRSAVWLGVPTLLLFVIGSTPVVEGLVGAEERAWARGDSVGVAGGEGVADAVVALGGDQRASRYDLLGFNAGDAASRVLTAVELVREGQARNLVLGGSLPPPDGSGRACLAVVQDWITRWKFTGDSVTVTNLGICRNTHDEALAFKKMVEARKWKRVILVTSALHLRRSVAVFKKAGVEVVPVAADFQVWGTDLDWKFSPFPRVDRVRLLTLYTHEKIGWWGYWARGWISGKS